MILTMSDPRTELKTAVKGNRREQLEAIRDYIANELESNLCNTCLNSRLRTGDQASLILRLQGVLEELDALPTEDKKVSRLESLQLRAVGSIRRPDTEGQPLSGKNAARKSGSRRIGEDNRHRASGN